MFLSDDGGCTEEPGGRDDTRQPGIVSTSTAADPSWGRAQNDASRLLPDHQHLRRFLSAVCDGAETIGALSNAVRQEGRIV